MSDLQNGREPSQPEPPAWPNTPPANTPGAAWPPPPQGAYYPGAPEREPVYRPVGGIALWTVIMLTICLVMCFLAAMFELAQAVGGITPRLHEINQVIDQIQQFSYLPCFVLFSVWVYGVCANADWFSARSLPTSPGWAVGYFFVPILWYFKPYQALRDAWKASDPAWDLSQNPRAWQTAPNSPLVVWWWTLWIIAGTLGVGISTYAAFVEGTSIGEMAEFLSDALSAGSAAAAIGLVRALNARQEEKYRKLTSSAEARP